VNRDTPKPKPDAPSASPAAPAKPAQERLSGRVKHDDRGNAIWEWAVTTGKFTTETSTQRLKRLDNPTLSLAEDAPTPFDVVKRNPLGAVKGYSPYDSGLLDKKQPPRKKDLQKLSEWLKLKKQAANNDPDAE
jgi:hypothetical protein